MEALVFQTERPGDSLQSNNFPIEEPGLTLVRKNFAFVIDFDVRTSVNFCCSKSRPMVFRIALASVGF